MVLLVDGAAVDETTVEGMLPVALQHGGAGLRLGWDSGFPVSPRYTPPAPFSGTVHQVRIDTPGCAAARPGRRGADRAPRRLTAGSRPRAGRSVHLARRFLGVRQVLAGMAGRHRGQGPGRQGRGRRPGRTAPQRSSSSSLSERSNASSRAPFSSRSATVSAGRTPAARTRVQRVGLVDALRACRRPRRRAPCSSSQRRALRMALGDVMERRRPRSTPRPARDAPRLPRRRTPANATTSALAATKSSAERAGPLTRHGAPRPARSAPRCATTPGGAPSAAARTARRCSSAFTGVGTPCRRAHEHDLPVEELGLDRPRTAGQALPAGAPLPLARGRGRHLEVSRRGAHGPPRSSPRRCPPRRAPPCPPAAPRAPAR